MTLKSYSDLSGDGGSQIIEQVIAQRAKIKENLAGVRKMIAVGSAKGGVGKSTLTMQLGSTLNQLGHQTALLDADLNGPSLARLANLKNTAIGLGKNGMAPPRTKNGMGVVSFGTLVPESQAVDFQTVSQGESYTWRATKEFSVLGDFLAKTEWGELDYLLVDLPPGAERSFQFAEFFGPETAHVLVTLPSELSYGVVTRGIASLQKAKAPILGYIENMSGYYCKDCGATKPLYPSNSTTSLDIPLLGRVPFDPELARWCDQGKSIEEFPDSPAARSIQVIAKTMIEEILQ